MITSLVKVEGIAEGFHLVGEYEGEMCVQHMAELLGVSQSAVSHLLRILKGARLVRYRREGKTVYYCLADDHVRKIIECGTEHINE